MLRLFRGMIAKGRNQGCRLRPFNENEWLRKSESVNHLYRIQLYKFPKMYITLKYRMVNGDTY